MTATALVLVAIGLVALGVVIGFVLGWIGCEQLNGDETRRERRTRLARQADEQERTRAVIEALAGLVVRALFGAEPTHRDRNEQHDDERNDEQAADRPRLPVGVV